uniref:Uncharacterized protein n=1 Tax=Rhizophora mucronata TaxID=61149 RepID=A0A2P2IRT3_RHIMU
MVDTTDLFSFKWSFFLSSFLLVSCNVLSRVVGP